MVKSGKSTSNREIPQFKRQIEGIEEMVIREIQEIIIAVVENFDC